MGFRRYGSFCRLATLFGCGFRCGWIALVVAGGNAPALAAVDREPDIFTLARLTAWNRGPGELRAEAGWAARAPAVMVARGREVVFKIDWHFADETPLRTLTGKYAAEVLLEGEGNRAVSGRRTHERSSGPAPAAVARDAAALEIPVELPAAVGLLWGRLRVRAEATAYETTRDTGWQEFPFVVVRTDLASAELAPETLRAVGVAFGDLVWLQGKWRAAAAERWVREASEKSPTGRTPIAGHLRSRDLVGLVAEAVHSLSSLLPSPLRHGSSEAFVHAADCLLECARRLPGDCPARLATDLKAGAKALTAAAKRERARTNRKPKATSTQPLVPASRKPGRPPEPPLRNGDFGAGLKFWKLTGDAAVGSPALSVKVEQEKDAAVLCLQRAPGALTFVSGGVEQAVDIPVGAATRLEAEVWVGEHSPAGGGDLGTVFPLTLWAEYVAADGSSHWFSQSFYTLGKAVWRRSAMKLPAARWYHYRSSSFAALVPPAVRIVRVRIVGAGRSFVSRVKEVTIRGN